MLVKTATILAVAASGLLLITGCQSWKAAHSGNGNGNMVSPQRSPEDVKFETTNDPPIKAQTYFAAGQVAENRQDYNRAIEQYWAAVKVEPKYKDALFRLGVVYAQLHLYPDAIVAWKQYVKASDGDATGYSNLAFCYELAGKPADAEETYLKGIERDPRNNPCRVNYGLMLARNNRIGEATIQLQTVLTPAEVHYNLASVYELQGRNDQSRGEYRKALTLDPNLSDAEARLAILK